MRRTILLYLFAFVITALSFNRQVADINYLNYLKDIEDYLQDVAAGKAVVDQARISEGIRYYQKVLKVMPKNAYAFGNMGFCSFYLNDYKEAAAYYQKAITLEPGEYTFYTDLGDICFLTKNFKDAVTFYGNSLALLPNSEAYYWQVAKSLHGVGRDNFAAQFARLAMQAKVDRGRISEKLADIRLLTSDPTMKNVSLSGVELQKYKPHWNPQIVAMVRASK